MHKRVIIVKYGSLIELLLAKWVIAGEDFGVSDVWWKDRHSAVPMKLKDFCFGLMKID